MTINEAMTVLGVGASATTDEIRRAYNELYTDLQIRLTNAPTPQLRKAYQKNIQELREACDLLAPGFVVDAVQDLPSSQPTVGGQSSAPPRQNVSPQRPTTQQPAPRPGPTAESAGLPRSTMIAAGLAIAMAATAVFLILRAVDAGATLDKQATTIADLTKKTEALGSRAALVENGQFKVCNKSSEKVTVTWIAVGFRDGAALKSFNSALCEIGPWPVSAGGSVEITVDRTGCQWDGSVLFFALNVKLADGSEYPVAGAWSEVAKGCAKVAE